MKIGDFRKEGTTKKTNDRYTHVTNDLQSTIIVTVMLHSISKKLTIVTLNQQASSSTFNILDIHYSKNYAECLKKTSKTKTSKMKIREARALSTVR